MGGGIFAERKERYRTLGRALIGGGWAVTVLVTYGLRHAPFMAILSSNALDLLLLLGGNRRDGVAHLEIRFPTGDGSKLPARICCHHFEP